MFQRFFQTNITTAPIILIFMHSMTKDTARCCLMLTIHWWNMMHLPIARKGIDTEIKGYGIWCLLRVEQR